MHPLLLLAGILVLAYVTFLLFTPQSSTLTGSELKVRTWMLTFTFDLRQATEVKAIAKDQLRRGITLRLFGVGWPLKPFGWFRSSHLGTYLNLVDDPSRMYLVRLPQRQILMSPAGGMKELPAVTTR